MRSVNLGLDEDVRITRAIVGALREHDLTGFEIWQWLGPVHGSSGTLTEATIYPLLHRFEAEGLIEGAWYEEGSPRRKYRITSTGLRLAEREGWGPVAFRRFHGVLRGPAHNARTGGGLDLDESDYDAGEWSWPAETLPLPGDEALPPGSPEAVAVGVYLTTLEDRLRLSTVHRSDVHNEIADHIADETARLRVSGSTSADAVAEALAALGPPDMLAERINTAQLTGLRFRRGLSWGSAFGMLAALFGFALSGAALMIATPFAAAVIPAAAGAIGIHLYVPFSGELAAEAFLLALCVGAFVGARRSMPFLAHRSRRADFVVWRAWAIAGGLPLLALALLMPVALDLLNAAILLGLPVAWVLGTRWPARLYGETVTTGGLALAIAVLALLMFVPGGRIWYYDPGTQPASDPTRAGDTSVGLVWTGSAASPAVEVTLTDLPAGWHDAKIEVWPAHRIGPVVVLDEPSAGPSLVVPSDGYINFERLPGNRADWWITVTAQGPDGQAHVLHSEVRFGDPPERLTSILGWLVGLL